MLRVSKKNFMKTLHYFDSFYLSLGKWEEMQAQLAKQKERDKKEKEKNQNQKLWNTPRRIVKPHSANFPSKLDKPKRKYHLSEA